MQISFVRVRALQKRTLNHRRFSPERNSYNQNKGNSFPLSLGFPRRFRTLIVCVRSYKRSKSTIDTKKRAQTSISIQWRPQELEDSPFYGTGIANSALILHKSPTQIIQIGNRSATSNLRRVICLKEAIRMQPYDIKEKKTAIDFEAACRPNVGA